MTTQHIRVPIRDLIPQLTDEQVKAINDNQPIPPSPNWVPPPDWKPPAQALAATAGAATVTLDAPTLPIPNGFKCKTVTAILVISAPARIAAAKTAIAMFRRQAYEHRRLIVVNATGSRWHECDAGGLERVLTVSGGTVGELRNIGLSACQSDWFVAWDDDDCYHEEYLARLMAKPLPGRTIAMLRQLRINVTTGAAYLAYDPRGLASTALFPHTRSTRYREDLPFGLDSRLYSDLSRSNPLDEQQNNAVMRIALYHGHNLSPESMFMQGCPPQGQPIPIGLQADAIRLLAERGFTVKFPSPEDPVWQGLEKPPSATATPASPTEMSISAP